MLVLSMRRVCDSYTAAIRGLGGVGGVGGGGDSRRELVTSIQSTLLICAASANDLKS